MTGHTLEVTIKSGDEIKGLTLDAQVLEDLLDAGIDPVEGIRSLISGRVKAVIAARKTFNDLEEYYQMHISESD